MYKMKFTPAEEKFIKTLAKAKEISFEKAKKNDEILNLIVFRRDRMVDRDVKEKLLKLTDPVGEGLEDKPSPIELKRLLNERDYSRQKREWEQLQEAEKEKLFKSLETKPKKGREDYS